MAYLGIDIGGTKVVLALAGERGEGLRSVRRPMSLSGDWRQDLDGLVGWAREWLGEARADLRRIGVSVPGPADPLQGRVLNPPNLPGWLDVPLGPELERALGVETRIENDANAAALAEHAYGSGRGIDDLVYLTMSTGIGGGVISGGQLVRGAFGAAGEAGHVPIQVGGALCACGLRGCLEAYVGGNAWRDRLRREAPAQGRVAALAGGNRADILPEHLVEAAREGDAYAVDAFGVWLEHLASGLVPLVMLLEPRRIVLGTIAAAAGEALCFAPLRSRVAARLWPQQAARLEIVPAALGRALPERAGLAVALEGVEGTLG
jgi:glucokinase